MKLNLPPLLDKPTAELLGQLIEGAQNIVLTCHVSPDGDAIGSTLGLSSVLKAIGKNTVVITPDAPPRQLSFLPGIADIQIASYHQGRVANIVRNADLIFCLDFNDYQRLDKFAQHIAGSTAPKVLMDHHLDPKVDADVVVSHPELSSTSSIVYRVINELGLTDLLDTDAASCIFTGMMTDTGNFSYNSTDPNLYPIVGDLVGRGVDKDDIYTRVYNTTSEKQVRLHGYALYKRLEIFPEHKTALITLSQKELEEFEYEKGYTEGLVNVPLSIPGVVCSVFMRQDQPEYVKISTRSKGDFAVNVACERYFGGGGHLNAAGGEWNGSLDEAVDRLLTLMKTRCYPWGENDNKI